MITHNRGYPKIAIGLSFYNDLECMKKRLFPSLRFDSINRPFGKIYAIDGIYAGYGETDINNRALSTDGSRELIQDYILKYGIDNIELYDMPFIPEWQKRQAYVDMARNDGYQLLLVIDSDEFISKPTLDWRKMKVTLRYLISKGELKKGNVYGILMHDKEQQYTASRPRLWVNLHEMRYAGKHNVFAKKHVIRNLPSDFMEITHSNEGFRTQERIERQKEYEYGLAAIECTDIDKQPLALKT